MTVDRDELLASALFDEKRVVTVRWFSRHADVAAPEAIRLLDEFYEKRKGESGLNATYFVSGSVAGGDVPTRRSMVVGEAELELARREHFDEISSCHVYSLQCCVVKDVNSLYNVDYGDNERFASTDFRRAGIARCKIDKTKSAARDAAVVTEAVSVPSAAVKPSVPPKSAAKPASDPFTPLRHGEQATVSASTKARSGVKRGRISSGDQPTSSPAVDAPAPSSATAGRLTETLSASADLFAADSSPDNSPAKDVGAPAELRRSPRRQPPSSPAPAKKKTPRAPTTAKPRQRGAKLGLSLTNASSSSASASADIPPPPPPLVEDDEEEGDDDFIPPTPPTTTSRVSKKLVTETYLDGQGYMVVQKVSKQVADEAPPTKKPAATPTKKRSPPKRKPPASKTSKNAKKDGNLHQAKLSQFFK